MLKFCYLLQINNISIEGFSDNRWHQIIDDVSLTLNKGESIGTIEAVKTVADIYMPISGKIVELNELLNDTPETVNNDPFINGWMLKIKIEDMDETSTLMDWKKYNTFIS